MSLKFSHLFMSKPCGQNVCPNIIVIVLSNIPNILQRACLCMC